MEHGPNATATYIYTVTNNSKYPIYGFEIGEADDEYELSVVPDGCVLREEYCACQLKAPPEWTGCIHGQERNDKVALHFFSETEDGQIQPRGSKRFTVVLPRSDPKYQRTRFQTFAGPGCSFTGAVGQGKRATNQ